MSIPIIPQMPFVWPEPRVSSGVGRYDTALPFEVVARTALSVFGVVSAIDARAVNWMEGSLQTILRPSSGWLSAFTRRAGRPSQICKIFFGLSNATVIGRHSRFFPKPHCSTGHPTSCACAVLMVVWRCRLARQKIWGLRPHHLRKPIWPRS